MHIESCVYTESDLCMQSYLYVQRVMCICDLCTLRVMFVC